MDNLNRISVSWRARSLRPYVVGFLVLLAGVLCVSRAFLHAAPVTLRFEATVASSFPSDGGASLPFLVSPGDSIVTTITFEPGTAGPVYPQNGTMRFDLVGTSLVVTDFQIVVGNDRQIWIDHPGRIADPNNTPDVDINAIGDNTIASCLDGAPHFCGTVQGSVNKEFRPLLVFTDPNPLLITSDELSRDPEIWNAFSRREMSLLFRDKNTGGSTYLGAYIAQVHEVPEPTIASLCLAITAAFAGYFVLARRQFATTFAFPSQGRKTRQRAQASKTLRFEQLEEKRLLAIMWANECVMAGPDDPNFVTYGPNEAIARQIVNRAIDDWEAMITDFNYDGDNNPATNNTFNLRVFASPISGRGSTGTTFVGGLPTQATVTLDDNGGGE